MKKFVIERNLAAPETITPEELQGMSQTSCQVAIQL